MIKNSTLLFYIFTFLFISLSIRAQSTLGVNLGPDDTLCDANLVNVTASFSAAGVDALIPADDVYSPAVDITFPFTYYGNVYNRCLLSTNSYITFDLADSSGYSPWSYTAPCPSSLLPLNSVFGVYQDLLPAVAGGNVAYGILGTAPNRVFVYSTCNVPMFSCTGLHASNQIMLYEGSNNIEVHVGWRDLCATWNSGNGLIGIQDNTGTNGITPSTRNTGPWTASNEAWRFTPTGGTYNVTSIPFSPLPILPANGVFFYVDGVFAGSGTSIDVMVNDTVQIIAVADTTANFECGFSDSFLRTMKLTDTMYLYNASFDYTVNSTTATCLHSNDNAIRINATGNIGTGSFHFTWEDTSGVIRDIYQSVTPAYDSITGIEAGQYWYTVSNGMCRYRDSAQLNPVFYAASFNHNTPLPYCAGQMLSFTNTSTGTYASLSYDFGDGTIDTLPNPNHAYTTAGPHTVKLIIYTISGCTDTATFDFLVGEPPLVDLGNDTTICDDKTVVLDAGTRWDNCLWQDGSTNRYLTINTSGIYKATVSNTCGTVSDSVNIVVQQCACNLAYPDAFTPNGDDKNETYAPVYSCSGLTSFNMKIFNRWGNLVYETNDINTGWNGKFHGKEQPIGTYVYYIKVTSSNTDKVTETNGVFNLLR
ncbi:MAG: gliding motility-associated C-terminal domain-containing protein [Bacteroidota bacterium]